MGSCEMSFFEFMEEVQPNNSSSVPAEVYNKHKAFFSKLDFDNDGTIDIHDFVTSYRTNDAQLVIVTVC
jgi:Ca2+-binding EF-hand superfamily protein